MAENMATMTGLLGLADNSNGFNIYASKVVTIAAGESYQYTFVNYNKGSEGTDVWENWVVEGRRSDNGHCFDFRADGGFWTWKPDADVAVLNASYAGNTSVDVSATAKEWLAAYNGVTVTLTVSRSNDGDVITVAHSATTNTSSTYAGTFTCSGFGTGAATIVLTNEDSHQVINKVVYQHSTGGIVYTARTTHISGTDADVDTSYGDEFNPSTGYNKIYEGSVNLANKNWNANNIVYVQVDATDVPTSGVTMTSAILSLKAYGLARDHNIGIGYNSSVWSNGLTWNTADRTITTLGETQKATKNVNASLDFDIMSAVSAGSTKTLLIYDTAAGSAPLWDISATISYSTETLYTATFTETNSLAPTITIYSDSERTAEVVNGTLLSGNTYYYTATLEGYNDYQGSFTVSGANPDVNFTMTALPRYTFTVNAVNSEGGAVIKTLFTDDDSYDGKTYNVYYPAYLTTTGNVVTYSKDNSTYWQNLTSTSGDATKTVSYTAYTGTAWFYEGEEIDGATTYTTATFAGRSSNGATGVLRANTVATLDVGSYTISARVIGKANNTCSIYKTSTSGEQIMSLKTSTTGVVNVANITLDAATDIVADGGYYTTTDNGFGFDYILIEKVTSVTATIASSGYSTIASSYALDCANLPLGLKAYKVTGVTKTAVNLEEVSEAVQAGTGLILEGAPSETYSIPVAVSGLDLSTTNKLKAAVTATNVAANEAYILQGGKFHLVTEASAVPAGKAYLLATDVPVNVRALDMVVDGDTDGIMAIDNAQSTDNAIFDLSGRRVVKAQKGIYIVNGKKVVK